MWSVVSVICVSSILFPITIYQMGKCSVKRELRKNIIELQKMKENSNDEISYLIDIHLNELKKIDEGLFKYLEKKS